MAKRMNEDAADKGFQIPIEDADAPNEAESESPAEDLDVEEEAASDEPVSGEADGKAPADDEATEGEDADDEDIVAEAEAVIEDAVAEELEKAKAESTLHL